MIDTTLKNSNILIVDDQEANIDVLGGFLLMQGYNNIKTTTDPREVVPLFASFNPDLILLDLSMPYLTGFEVMEQLKAVVGANTYLPILVLTADVTTEAKQKALSGGATDFLTKPFDLVEVGLRIRNLLLTSYLQQQLQKQNQILEVKVKERTFELEKTNADLVIARDKAEASDRLKTAFMQNISHEVRTPLNGILGFCTLITDPDYPVESKQGLLPMLEASCSRLINTITNYIDISLIVSGNIQANYKSINLTKTINELIEQFQGICDEKHLTISCSTPSNNEVEIQTDPKLFQKVVSQIIDNSIKFTHEGSISIGYSVDSGNLEIFVKDTGVGIGKEAQDKIFESFTQEDISVTRGYEGSGVGLTVVKGFLKILGGEIHLESEKGKGSIFTVSFPSHAMSSESVELDSEKPKKSIVKDSVILIVEDDFPNRLYIHTILKSHAETIYQASNGLEVVDICREHPEISLVLMDIKMPEMNGIEATIEIKKFRKELPIIAVTAYAMSGDEKRMLEAGCSDYLQKPINKEKLFALLKDYGLGSN